MAALSAAFPLLTFSSAVRDLGVTLDCELTLPTHINLLSRDCFYQSTGMFGSGVVVLLQELGQTKESARRYVIYCVALWGCGPYVSIVWRSAICFYCVALGHMFLLCGARPYVSIVWGSAICFYCVCV